MGGSFRVRRDMPYVDWRKPATVAEVHARCATPRGEATLVRERGPRTCPEDHADAVETWTVSLRDGEAALKVHRLMGDSLYLRWRMWKGVDGEVDGEPFRFTGTSALRRSRRSVTCEGPTIDVRIVPRAFGLRLVERGEDVGSRSYGTDWELPEPTDHAVLAVCLFEWVGLGDLLRTPVLRDL
ncbi:hypothetical protein ACFQ8C_06725 [Streptomyces sp. NPDC056503]|uniref:hypothetical protein n=1 Tax=Streptomyces sp. NPDC056503 TaxID=3345842 RepID=UPI0036A9D502